MATWEAKQVVFGEAFLGGLLGTLAAVPAAALLATGKLRLSADPLFAPVPGSTLASLVSGEATFTGYPAGGVAFLGVGPVNISSGGRAIVQDHVFVGGAAFAVANNLTGWWIDDGTNFAVGEAFGPGNAVGINATGDFLDLLASIPLEAFQDAA